MSKSSLAAGLTGLLLAIACSLVQAGERATPREARALFDQAVHYLEANGPEKSWAAFSNTKGPFVKKDLYVYAINRQGTYVANGAAPDTLVGLNVLDSVDAAGTPLFRHMIAVTDKQDEARIRYVWLNRKTNHVEPKNAWLHRQGDYIIGVGYYAPHATADDAIKLLNEAVALAGTQPMASAAQAFNDSKGKFVHDDLYVFAVNLDTGKFEAHGMNPGWTGTDARNLRDVEGHPLIQEMIDLANSKGEGVVDYVWRNPITNAIERKRSFIRRVGNSLLGVGYYLD
ncbi:MAG: cache domain-containing protein [Bacteroidota bacterium]